MKIITTTACVLIQRSILLEIHRRQRIFIVNVFEPDDQMTNKILYPIYFY